MNMSYTCDDIDKTYDELKKRGVEFEGPPQKQPWGTYAILKDNEGNRFVPHLTENTRGVWLSHADVLTLQTARPAVAPYHLRISTRYFLPARV